MNEWAEEGSRRKRRFSEEFKRDAVRLIVEEGYTSQSAATAVGVSDQSLRDEIKGTDENGINLSWKLLCGKLLAKLASWLSQQSVLFGTALEDTRLIASRAVRVDE